jgi:hypothetical protein
MNIDLNGLPATPRRRLAEGAGGAVCAKAGLPRRVDGAIGNDRSRR